MNESRLRVGSKIKIISDPASIFCKIGDIGTLVNGSLSHSGDALKDNNGQYWANFKHSAFSKIRFGLPNDTSCFKVIKY